ncbi:caspase family protein [Streptomyces parvus]|uniref:caspase family protein n=1 Tax=Streptomyces parvus TaxID=66428 RepID=UPI00362AAA7F
MLVLGGSSRYEHQEELPGVKNDLDTVDQLFRGLGYGLGARFEDLEAADFRRALSAWASAEDRTDDVLVLYVSGHGEYDHHRHYLLCRDSRTSRLTGTALATEDLAGIVAEAGFERLLLMIDTCYAGQGGTEAARRLATDLCARLSATPNADPHRLRAFAVIAATRTGDQAADGAFASALARAVHEYDPILGGHRQPKLYLEQVVDRVNKHLRHIAPGQHAALGILPAGEGHDFFPNPHYAPDLPGELMDLAEQETWLSPEGRARRAELRAHFEPRGRANDGLGGRGSYFTGRAAALQTLLTWLDRGQDAVPGNVVVTGRAGVGKSSLLGRVVLLADPGHRAELPDLPPGTVLPGTRVDAAIHARDKTLEDIVAGIADAAGLDTRTPEELLDALETRQAMLTLVIDSLDEAGPAGTDTEAGRIVGALLQPLSRMPRVRLLVGARPRATGDLGQDWTVLDLDDPRWIGPYDVEQYARKLLLAPDGPGSQGYADEGIAATTAAAIAERSGGHFLFVRLAARALARGETPPGPGGDDRWHRLPPVDTSSASPAGRAFRWALHEQLGEKEGRGRSLLTALALAEGPGLPAGPVWCAIASELTGDEVTTADIRWILGAAGDHIVEDVDRSGRSVYRLYHASFADELRTAGTEEGTGRLLDALTALVPLLPDRSGPNWPAADPYIRDHLTSHAVVAGRLDALVGDPLFVVTVEPTALRRALPRLRADRSVAVRDTYERVAPLLAQTPDPRARAALLRLTALELGHRDLADTVSAGETGQPWWVDWAIVPSPPHPHRSVGHFPVGASLVALLNCGERRLLVTSEGNMGARVWDADTCELLGDLPLTSEESDSFSNRYVSAVATGAGEGGPHILVAVSDGPSSFVEVWDVERRARWGRRFTVQAEACALVRYGDTLVAGLLTDEGEVLVVDMRDGVEHARLPMRSAMEDPPMPETGIDGDPTATTPSEGFGVRRFSGESRIAMEVHEGRIVIAALPGLTVSISLGSFSEGRVWRWNLRPENRWQAIDERTCLIRSWSVDALTVHRGEVHTATRDKTLRHQGPTTDSVVDHGNGFLEWIRASQNLTDKVLFLASGQGVLRLDVGMSGVESVDLLGRRRHVLHARLSGFPTSSVTAIRTGSEELLMVQGDGSGGAVTMWTFRLDETSRQAPVRFDGFFKPLLTVASVGGRELLALTLNTLVRLVDPETGRVTGSTPKRVHAQALGASGLPLLTVSRAIWRGTSRPVRLTGTARRRARLQDCPEGHADVLLATTWRGKGTVLAVVGQHLGIWTLPGEKVCTLELPDTVAGADLCVVGQRLFVVCSWRNGGIDVLEFPSGQVVRHLETDRTSSLRHGSVGHKEVGGLAMDVWDGEPVVGHLTQDGGIDVHRVRDGCLVWQHRWSRRAWSWTRGPHVTQLYLHRIAGRRVALAVDSEDMVVHDVERNRGVIRIPMGSTVQSLQPLSDGRVAVLTRTGLFCLAFPAFSAL